MLLDWNDKSLKFEFFFDEIFNIYFPDPDS
jgi:hypothetical protein